MEQWTERDTEICKQGIASGLAINVNTCKPLTYTELRAFAVQFDKTRDTISALEFLKDKVSSRPF